MNGCGDQSQPAGLAWRVKVSLLQMVRSAGGTGCCSSVMSMVVMAVSRQPGCTSATKVAVSRSPGA